MCKHRCSTHALDRFLVQCLRYFSCNVMSDKNSLYSLRLSLNPFKTNNMGVYFCCVSSSLMLFGLFLFLFDCEKMAWTSVAILWINLFPTKNSKCCVNWAYRLCVVRKIWLYMYSTQVLFWWWNLLHAL